MAGENREPLRVGVHEPVAAADDEEVGGRRSMLVAIQAIASPIRRGQRVQRRRDARRTPSPHRRVRARDRRPAAIGRTGRGRRRSARRRRHQTHRPRALAAPAGPRRRRPRSASPAAASPPTRFARIDREDDDDPRRQQVATVGRPGGARPIRPITARTVVYGSSVNVNVTRCWKLAPQVRARSGRRTGTGRCRGRRSPSATTATRPAPRPPPGAIESRSARHVRPNARRHQDQADPGEEREPGMAERRQARRRPPSRRRDGARPVR